jgi:hypothetical protein
MGAMRNKYNFVGKCEGKRPLRRSGQAWEDTTKLDLKEMEGEGENAF